jgi:hypothetical protein
VPGGELELFWEPEGLFELPGVLEFGEPGVVGDVPDCELGVVGDVGAVVEGLDVDGLVDVDGEVDDGGAAPEVAAPAPAAPDAPPDCACDVDALARAKVTAIAM